MSSHKADFDRLRNALDVFDGPHFGGGATTDYDEQGRYCFFFRRNGQRIFLGHSVDEAIQTYREKYRRN